MVETKTHKTDVGLARNRTSWQLWLVLNLVATALALTADVFWDRVLGRVPAIAEDIYISDKLARLWNLFPAALLSGLLAILVLGPILRRLHLGRFPESFLQTLGLWAGLWLAGYWIPHNPGELTLIAGFVAASGLLALRELSLRFDRDYRIPEAFYIRPMQVLIDGVVVAGTFLIAYLIRFDGSIPPKYVGLMFVFMGASVILFLAGNFFWGVYSFVWRFTSLTEAIGIGKAVGSCALLTIVARLARVYGSDEQLVPLGVLFIHPLLVYLGFLFFRALRRFQYRTETQISQFGKEVCPPRQLLLIGAGNAGQLLVRELEHNPEFQVCGFLDDDPGKKNRVIHGVRVWGTTDELLSALGATGATEIALSMPTAPKKLLRRIVAQAEELGVRISSVPSLSEIITGKVAVSRLQPIRMEDLLGRSSIEYATGDPSLVETYRGQRILVTGAAGSIGSELVRQLCQFEPACLFMLDRNENGLYELSFEMRRDAPCEMQDLVADVRDLPQLRRLFEKHRPEVIFHAAAYKHVPMMEQFPSEAIRTNVLGTRNMVELSAEFRIESLVLVSTDKAVNPTNIMGASKRIAELLVQRRGLEISSSRFCCVRFGNVLGSQASVVPLFRKQIQEGRNLTVTHPEIRRFFMTIPEAVQLVIQAGSMGQNGNLFVLDMGAPVRILDLARQLIRLSGLVEGKDIDIEFTGLRQGEKMSEELLTPAEQGARVTRYPKILVTGPVAVDWGGFSSHLVRLEEAALRDDDREVVSLLQEMDIGFKPVSAPAPAGAL